MNAPALRLLALLALAAPAGWAAENSPLANASSAFVRAQAGSAIRWQPWSDATLARAHASGRSVYVFVGSPLSELTRATIEQTFTSERTIAWLNQNFTCVFVDADTEPAVAALAQHFIESMKQLRGWPVHLWLTPDLRPYDGSNYLPPSEEWGRPGFLKAARAALDAWTVEPARARALADEAASRMGLSPPGATSAADLKSRLDRATAAWLGAADARHGGFGSAPKEPEPELIRFLLTRGGSAREAAIKAARALASGAVRDPDDGGFYRRAIDEEWREPYRQKTLVDQARIALALSEAAEVAKDDGLRAAARGALEFALRELRRPDGTFAAALDGTREENEPTKRPGFVPAGDATTGAEGLLIVALQRAGETRLSAVAKDLANRLRDRLEAANFALEHIHGQRHPGTAADHLAVAWAFRTLKDDTTAEALLRRAIELYFDAATGTFLAVPARLPPGIALRIPDSIDAPSAASLAQRAGADAKVLDLLRRAIGAKIEYDELPPGDLLLALAESG